MGGARIAISLLAAASALLAQPLGLASFDKVWTTIRDTHWEKQPGGLDWDAIRAEYRPRAEGASSPAELRAVLQEMLARLGQTHFSIVPGSVYATLGERSGGPADAGFDLRVLDGQAVVTSLEPGSPADRAGVRPGWILTRANGEALAPIISAARANPHIQELQLTRALLARVSGAPGEMIAAEFLDGGNRLVATTLAMASPRGELASFGNLPPMRVWHEERRIGAALYFRFNMFLDVPRIMPAFERALKSCGDCRGLILDLRGNPGGVGGMAMGMAGFFIEDANRRLGTMYLRDATLDFVINPRPEVFRGPLAILLDACSASTSEILAGGLQALGRARVFGTRSAAAALPSVFERLPNGDGFQYAIANYVSLDGQALEGRGVRPDVEIRLTRQALLEGRDPVVEAALAWIEETNR